MKKTYINIRFRISQDECRKDRYSIKEIIDGLKEGRFQFDPQGFVVEKNQIVMVIDDFSKDVFEDEGQILTKEELDYFNDCKARKL